MVGKDLLYFRYFVMSWSPLVQIVMRPGKVQFRR